MSVFYSDLITEPIDEDHNIIKLTSDGQIITLYFNPEPYDDNETYLKDIICADVMCIFNIEYISISFPKPSREQHKWIIIADGYDDLKPRNVFSQHKVFFGDLLIAQRCEGRICAIPKADLDLIPDLGRRKKHE